MMGTEWKTKQDQTSDEGHNAIKLAGFPNGIARH